MSRRVLRSLITTIACAVLASGLPTAVHADTTVLSLNDSPLTTIQLNAPAGISAFANITQTPTTTGSDVRLTLLNTSTRTISMKATALSLTYLATNLAHVTSVPFAANELNDRVLVLEPASTYTWMVGSFSNVTMGHIEDLGLMSYIWTGRRFDITMSDISTFNWNPIREKLISSGLTVANSGFVRTNSIDNNSVAVTHLQQGAYINACNKTGRDLYFRVNAGQIGTVQIPLVRRLYGFNPNDCIDIWLGDTAALYGQANVAMDAIVGNVFNVNYTALDTFLSSKKIQRTSDFKIERLPFDSSLDYFTAYVELCLRPGGRVDTTYRAFSKQMQPWADPPYLDWTWLPSDTLAPSLANAQCASNRRAKMIFDYDPWRIFETFVNDPDYVLELNATSDDVLYTGAVPVNSTFDVTPAKAAVEALGLRYVSQSSQYFDAGNARYWQRVRVCNDTSITRYAYLSSFEIDGVRTYIPQPVFQVTPAGTCGVVQIGYVTKDNDNFTNAMLTPEFLPQASFSTSALDTALRSAGLNRVGPLAVDYDSEDVGKQVVEVPVCTRSHKERKIYVGAVTITARIHDWLNVNPDVQAIPGSCPAGGNWLTLGTFDTHDVTLIGIGEFLVLNTPQLVTANPSAVTTSSVVTPSGTSLTTTSSMLKFITGGVDHLGTTEVWADVNVTLAKKSKTYTLGSVTLGGTTVASVTIKGACKTVKVGKAQMCQRRVKLGTVPGNWLYSKTLIVNGRLS